MAEVKIKDFKTTLGTMRVIEGPSWVAVESDLGITIQDPARDGDVVACILRGSEAQLSISLCDTVYVRHVLDMLDAYRAWKASAVN
jgi:hypothetical protein